MPKLAPTADALRRPQTAAMSAIATGRPARGRSTQPPYLGLRRTRTGDGAEAPDTIARSAPPGAPAASANLTMGPDDRERSVLPSAALLVAALLAAAVNRLSPWTDRPFVGHAWARWREIIAMFVLTPASATALWQVGLRVRMGQGCQSLFLALITLLAVSMGVHEPTNLLGRLFAGPRSGILEGLLFWDEVLSHAAFFVGFSGVSVLLVWAQVRRPRSVPESRRSMAVLTGIAVVLGVVIFANLAFEPARMDLRVGLFTWVLTAVLWIAHPVPPQRAPMAWLIALGYGVGFAGAWLYQAWAGRPQ